MYYPWTARLVQQEVGGFGHYPALDGMGIPLSLADPQITPAGAAQDVMTALRDMLSPRSG